MALSQSGACSQPDLLDPQESHVKRVLGGFSTIVKDNTASGNAVQILGPVADKVSNKYAVKYVSQEIEAELSERRRLLMRLSVITSTCLSVITRATWVATLSGLIYLRGRDQQQHLAASLTTLL
jgi:hypothetical protein